MNNNSKRKIFVLLIKPLTIKTYTSLAAIFEEYKDSWKEEIGISLSYLRKNIDFSTDSYENDKVKIDCSFPKTTGDIRREK